MLLSCNFKPFSNHALFYLNILISLSRSSTELPITSTSKSASKMGALQTWKRLSGKLVILFWLVKKIWFGPKRCLCLIFLPSSPVLCFNGCRFKDCFTIFQIWKWSDRFISLYQILTDSFRCTKSFTYFWNLRFS